MRVNRILALILTVVFLLAAVPFQAAAEAPMGTYNVEIYLADQEKGICRWAPSGEFRAALGGLPELPVAQAPSKEKRTAMLVMEYEEANGYLYTGYRHYYELRPGELKIDGVAYTLTQKQYDSLTKAVDKADKARLNHVQYHHPLWTTWTHHSDVTTLEIRDRGKAYPKKKYGEDYDGLVSMASVVYTMLYIDIKPDYSKVYKTGSSGSKLGAFPKATEAVMTLKSGRKLNVIINGKKLYVELSDRSYGYEYDLAGDEDPFGYDRKYLEMLK